jgi:hypothetical protein
MAEHNELGKLGEEMAGEFFERRIYYFGDQLTFQKQKLISLPKKKIHLLLK